MQGRSDRRWLPVLVMALTLPLMGLPPLTAGTAVAAPAWLPGQTLSAPGLETGGAQIGLAANGDAVAVWGAGEFTDAVTQAAHREAGGSWSAPVTISAPTLSGAPQLAVGPSGQAVAVWRSYDGANFRLQAAVRGPGGDWTAPINISPPGVEAYDPAVAIDGSGQITALWSRYDGVGFRVQARTRTAAGTWRLVENLSIAGGDARQPQVAVNSTDGETTASWSYGKLGQEAIHARTRPASSFTWKQPEDLSEGSGAIYPKVAVAATSETAVVWTRTTGLPNAAVEGRVRAAGHGSYGPIAELSAPDAASGRQTACDTAVQPQVAAAPAGDMTAVWTCASLDPFDPWEIVQTRAHEAVSDQWGAKHDLFTPAESDPSQPYPRVSVGGTGGAVAVWEKSWDDQLVQGATRPAGGAWGAVQTISPVASVAGSAEVAADGEGNAVTVWDTWDGDVHSVQAAPYDAAGPQLRELEIPATGTVGSPLGFSVSPVDAWSAVQSVEWDFGDGKAATGETVTHTYRRPGHYQARVTATDTLGNSTSANANVHIILPPLREAHKQPLP